MKKILSVLSMMALSTMLNAGGTAPSTDVRNTATLNFTVGGVTQTAVTSNEDSFLVDRKIDIQIAVNNSVLNTQPGASQVKLNFTVANQGNDAETWTLSLGENSGEANGFNVNTLTNCKLYVSGGAVIGSFPQDIAFTLDQNISYDVGCDIPANAIDTKIADIYLISTIKNRTNNTSDADVQGTVQNVFAEAASDNNDQAYTGVYTKTGTYKIVSPVLSFAKTSIVLSDDLANGTPHRIPGAVVRYCFDINNTGTADALNVRLTEDLTVTNKANLDYVKSGIIIQATPSSCDCVNLSDTTGTTGASATAVFIPSAAAGITIPAGQQACGYLEATIK